MVIVVFVVIVHAAAAAVGTATHYGLLTPHFTTYTYPTCTETVLRKRKQADLCLMSLISNLMLSFSYMCRAMQLLMSHSIT